MKKAFQNLGIRRDRDYFMENLSMLLASGMNILESLDAVLKDMHSKAMKDHIKNMQNEVESGSSLWRALESVHLFPEHTISLVRIGEESGKLSENLNVIRIQQEKERVLRSKLQSAMLYPVFVLGLTVVIGGGIAWFILPKLALVFSQLGLELPFITRTLIQIGLFLGTYGYIAVPSLFVLIGLFIFFLFFYSKTKFIGQSLLFNIPGIKKLVKESELSRFGYLLGTLMDAGLPVNRALSSLVQASSFPIYKKLYVFLQKSIEDGNSFKKSFELFPKTNKLLSSPLQQLIITGERTGALAETFLKIGESYEGKTETTTKNLSTLLEPVMLVIVWLGVVAVALAVILPIYNLVGQLNTF